MKICENCGMPDTRPNIKFVGNICQACVNYENREKINWKERKKQFLQICEKAKSLKGEYDCVCPVSGGKDSTFVVSHVVKQGLKPLLVTVMDEFTKTKAGTHNIKNISEKFNLDHIIVRHSPKTFKRHVYKDFVEILNPFKWIEERIYITPVKIAHMFNIPIMFYGENSAYEYGETNNLDTFFTLKQYPEITAYYYYAFFPYNEIETMNYSKKHGFRDLDNFDDWFRQGSMDTFSQIDSLAYMVHIWAKFPKFGFQRVCDMTSRMVRKGVITKEQADLLVKERDYICDPAAKRDFCVGIGISEEFFDATADAHANKDILYKDVNGFWRRKDLK